MTLSEFKAWFAGYAEEMDGPPTPKQWEKIKERVGKIDGTPITAVIYNRDYWRPYWVEKQPMVTWCNATTTTDVFDSGSAMYALGKADAEA